LNQEELARILRHTYEEAKRNEAAMQVHLFGIDYGQEIKKRGYKIVDIVRMAGLDKGYVAEVSKGVKLSAVVERKENHE